MDTPLNVTTWANAAADERRQNPGGPRPQTQIPSAVMLDFGGWRLLPPATIEAETNWEETPRWSLERPFEFADQRLLVRYPIEAAFLGDDGLCTGWLPKPDSNANLGTVFRGAIRLTDGVFNSGQSRQVRREQGMS